MNTLPIDGKVLAKSSKAHTAQHAAILTQATGRAPSLHVILVGEDPASKVYVASKERQAKRVGIEGSIHRLSETSTQEALHTLIVQLNDNNKVDGILLQLPLPSHLDAHAAIRLINPLKDVDGLHPYNSGSLFQGRPVLQPCTPLGCMSLLESTGISLEGKHALVIGRSHLVGKPMAMMLLAANCTVTMAHSRTQNMGEQLAQADVVIAAVGRPKMLKGTQLKPGAIVIDVGINRNDDGSLCGDVDYESAQGIASHITPVPGGVGPMTIAALLANTCIAMSLTHDVPLHSDNE